MDTQEPLTVETFGPRNRRKKIGHSAYTICREHENGSRWYIHEAYNNTETGDLRLRTGHYCEKLEEVIERFNGINRELYFDFVEES